MKHVVWLSAVLLLAPVARADADWIAGGFLGAAVTTRTYLAVTQSSSATLVRFDSVDYKGQSFHLPLYYGYRVAWFPGSGRSFGVEGEVIHMKAYAQTGTLVPATGTINGAPVAGTMRLDAFVQRFSLSHGQNLIFVNAVFRHAFGECGDYRTARLVGLARLGVGPTFPHVESTIGGVRDEHYERGAIAFQAAGGIEVLVWKKLHALAEYKFTRCRQSVNAAAGAAVETLLSSHHFVGGVAVHF